MIISLSHDFSTALKAGLDTRETREFEAGTQDDKAGEASWTCAGISTARESGSALELELDADVRSGVSKEGKGTTGQERSREADGFGAKGKADSGTEEVVVAGVSEITGKSGELGVGDRRGFGVTSRFADCSELSVFCTGADAVETLEDRVARDGAGLGEGLLEICFCSFCTSWKCKMIRPALEEG